MRPQRIAISFWSRLMRGTRPREPRDDLVEMYFDYYPGLVLLYEGGAYDSAGFDEGLVADLERWEGDHAEAVDEYLRFASKTAEREILARGRTLAERIAAALGSACAVEYMGHEIRSSGPPETPAAVVAIAAFAQEAHTGREQIRRQIAEGADLAWTPYPPGDPE